MADDQLAIINTWLQNRMEGRDPTPVTAIQTRFVDHILGELREVLGSDGYLITVRSSFRKAIPYLRPIYSYPEPLTKFLVAPENQRAFSFVLSERSKAPFTDILPKRMDRPEANGVFTALYAMGPEAVDMEGRLAGADKEFGSRIETFWHSLSQSNDQSLRDLWGRSVESGHRRYAFFAGRRKATEDQARFELDHIVAYYFDTEASAANISRRVRRSAGVIKSLFEGLDIIAAADATLFRSEGLQLLSRLLPQFSRKDIAPADKIAFAVERLRQLIGEHLIARHGGEKDALPAIHYVATSFEPTSTKKIYYPRFKIYPHVFRTQRTLFEGATYIAHRRMPSSVKLLLKHYVEKTRDTIVEPADYKPADDKPDPPRVTLAQDFATCFDAVERIFLLNPALASQVLNDNVPDQIHLASREFLSDVDPEQETALWRLLNRQVQQGTLAESLLAFVIEGPVVRAGTTGEHTRATLRQLPRGVLAIESTHVQAFSDRDEAALRSIAEGFAALIRQISHDNSALDYRKEMRDALAQQPDVTVALAALMLSVIKIDGQILQNLLPSAQSMIEELSAVPLVRGGQGLKPAEVESVLVALKDIAKLVGGTPDSEVDDAKVAAKIIKNRRLKVAEIHSAVRDMDGHAKAVLEEFLDAVPENFAWSGYLSAVAEALGDRASESLPNFMAINAGYSASNMFIASVAQQLFQIVKLSGLKNLDDERDNYLKYVRYKLPLAARIPMNAFAFDSTGLKGFESAATGCNDIQIGNLIDYKNHAYGALVSDLVSGDREAPPPESVRTLLSVTADLVIQPETKNPDKDAILKAIEAHFDDRSLSLWRVNATKLLTGYRNWVRDSLRVKEMAESPFSPLMVAVFSSVEDLTSVVQKSLNGDFFGRGPREDLLGDTGLTGIIHADLNARNLSWSEAIGQFVLIDFEHVMKEGIRLCDQSRLAVNIVCDIYSHFLGRPRIEPNEITEMVSNVIVCIDNLHRLSRSFWDASTETGKSYMAAVRAHPVGSLHATVSEVVGAVLSAAPVNTKSEQKIGMLTWQEFLGYNLMAAALREYQYSCNSLKRDRRGPFDYDDGVQDYLKQALAATGTHSDALKRLEVALVGLGERARLPIEDPAKIPTIRAAELSRHLVSFCVLLALLPKAKLLGIQAVQPDPQPAREGQ